MLYCKACDEELVFRREADRDNNENGEELVVPDDLQLPCGCHFHWQCVLDEASTVALSLKCPSCESYLPTNRAGPSATNLFLPSSPDTAILVRYANEGGVQTGLDILPSLTEEAYLSTHPETRPARAFHVMCSEGDVEGIMDLLVSLNEDAEEGFDPTVFLQYQDPLADMRSGLHLAVERVQQDVVWLLLWLCSTVPDDAFPANARQSAAAAGISRLSVGHQGDIRALQTASGKTAQDIFEQMPDAWRGLLTEGLLSP